ncbi:MAG TPA: hypothetical protein VMC07_00870 [Candidatus Omnitrophota bacterium]|nr:hypothetical protein [Candidatus Omnitrophota bacterium]
MSKKVMFLMALASLLFCLSLVSPVTFSSGTINSTGLNLTISVTSVPLTFDELDVSSTSITFYNLSYTSPSSCLFATSSYGTYSFTASNVSIDTSDVNYFPAIACGETTQQQGLYKYVSPTPEQMRNGYELVLIKGWQVRFPLENQTHTISLKSVSNNTAVITLSSSPVTFSISLNETKKIDFNNDNYYDLSIFLKNISNYNADVILTSIHEQITPENQNQEIQNNPLLNISNSDLAIIAGAAALLVIIILVIIYLKTKKKKQKNKK